MNAHSSPSSEWYEAPENDGPPSLSGYEVADALRDVLTELSYFDPTDHDAMGIDGAEAFADANVSTFNEVGILSRDHGLVLTLADGSEYQITIVRSR